MRHTGWADLRGFLEVLEERDDLYTIEAPVDPEWEVNGFTRIGLEREGPALKFEDVKGMKYPLVANLLGTGRRYLWALGLDQWPEFNDEWLARVESHVPTTTVDDSEAPCKQNTITGDDVDINEICNVKWHEGDRGPFMGTLTVAITKDPDSGWLNAGIYRMDNLAADMTGFGAPEYTHARQHYMKYQERGEPMPLACITGYDPLIEIAASTRTPQGINELEIAGALRGAPIEMVQCETIDLEVPARAEFVFEGYVPPDEEHIEGPFGEYTGFYGKQRTNPVYEIHHVSHRDDPIYMGAREQWAPSESFYVVGKSSQAEAYKTLTEHVPGIVDVRCDTTYEAVVKIDKLFKGHPQQVMDALWGSTYARYKHVIVVDDDIDIWDYEKVHWALSTRVKADRDVTVTSRRAGQWLDPAVPLAEKGWQSGLGIDATLPVEEYEFYDESPPVTVADPEVVEETWEQWEDELQAMLGGDAASGS